MKWACRIRRGRIGLLGISNWRGRFSEPFGRMSGDAGEHVGEVGEGVQAAALARRHEAEKNGGSAAPFVGACEEPDLAARDGAENSRKRVVRWAEFAACCGSRISCIADLVQGEIGLT